MGRHAERYYLKNDGSGCSCRVTDPGRLPGRPLGPRKMLKNGLHRVTANHGNLTHLIFVPPHSVVIDCGSTLCKACADDDRPFLNGARRCF
jgi:hypothetical protein